MCEHAISTSSSSLSLSTEAYFLIDGIERTVRKNSPLRAARSFGEGNSLTGSGERGLEMRLGETRRAFARLGLGLS